MIAHRGFFPCYALAGPQDRRANDLDLQGEHRHFPAINRAPGKVRRRLDRVKDPRASWLPEDQPALLLRVATDSGAEHPVPILECRCSNANPDTANGQELARRQSEDMIRDQINRALKQAIACGDSAAPHAAAHQRGDPGPLRGQGRQRRRQLSESGVIELLQQMVEQRRAPRATTSNPAGWSWPSRNWTRSRSSDPSCRKNSTSRRPAGMPQGGSGDRRGQASRMSAER